MRNGGEVANRGFIFQALIAILECLKRTDWDEVKMEPPTDYDKVDIQLYQNGDILSAIQVKSSINDFQRADLRKWLELARQDAPDAKEIHLYLVGDSYSASCRQYIQSEPEITTFPFDNLQRYCIGELVIYIQQQELSNKVSVADLESIYRNLFAETILNSIARRRISRAMFERVFREAIPIEKFEEYLKQIMAAYNDRAIPQCLTSIPLIDKEVGLVGREDILEEIHKMFDESSCIMLVSGLGGIGKTAVMQGVCSDRKRDGLYVAWINCGDSLQDDLLMLRDAFGVPKEEKADKAYESVKAGIQRLGKKLYLFMDDMSREVNKEERDIINALGVHVMITSRKEDLPFRKKKLGCLADKDAIKMFYGYYGGDEERRYEDTVWSIIASVNSHTLLVELLAKVAKEEGGTLDDFYETLKNDGFFAVSEEELETEHDDENLTIEESVIKLYKISGLSEEQQRIMKLFTIFTPEKEIYHKVREWAGFERKEMKKLVDLGWLERGGLENGYHIHQIVRDSLMMQLRKNGVEVNLRKYGNLLNRIIATKQYLSADVPYNLISERIVLTEDVARYLDYKIHRNHINESGIEKTHIPPFQKSNSLSHVKIEYKKKGVTTENKKDINDTGILFNNISGVYWVQGNYKKAQYYSKKALTLFKIITEKDDSSDIAVAYNNLAGIFCNQGEYKEALKYYGRALIIFEHLKGVNHPDTATTYNNIASVYLNTGDFEKALKYFEKALDIRSQMRDRDEYADVAPIYNNMAIIYKLQGDFEKAIKYCNEALLISEDVLGVKHVDTATTYNCLAGIYVELGDYKTAAELYLRSLSTYERMLGSNHPITVRVYYSLALVYDRLNEHEMALLYYEKVLMFLDGMYKSSQNRNILPTIIPTDSINIEYKNSDYKESNSLNQIKDTNIAFKETYPSIHEFLLEGAMRPRMSVNPENLSYCYSTTLTNYRHFASELLKYNDEPSTNTVYSNSTIYKLVPIRDKLYPSIWGTNAGKNHESKENIGLTISEDDEYQSKKDNAIEEDVEKKECMPEKYDKQEITRDLKAKCEMDPDQYDGCYELMRTTIESYARLQDLSALDFSDLNLVYLTTVGTWKLGIEAKKNKVVESHILPDDKKRLIKLLDDIWEKAGRNEYIHVGASGDRAIGIFGTGFLSFKRYVTQNQVQLFIKMLIDLIPMTDDNEMFNRAEETLSYPIKGMQAAAASMILHALKPFTFPILNSNSGNENIFEVLGVQLDRPKKLETYIDNCRKIKAFRDREFTCKNYRIYDKAAQKWGKY